MSKDHNITAIMHERSTDHRIITALQSANTRTTIKKTPSLCIYGKGRGSIETKEGDAQGHPILYNIHYTINQIVSSDVSKGANETREFAPVPPSLDKQSLINYIL